MVAWIKDSGDPAHTANDSGSVDVCLASIGDEEDGCAATSDGSDEGDAAAVDLLDLSETGTKAKLQP